MRRHVLSALAVVGLLAVPAHARPSFHVDWQPCATVPAVQCGTLNAPLDWSQPNDERVPIAVARRPADDPATRIGTIFFNPGGPGDPSTFYVINAERFFSPALRARFDLVALDPRGMGDSVHVKCAINPILPETTLFPHNEAQFQQLRRHNREVGRDCVRRTGPLLRNMDTVTVARDHEALRLALGVSTVSWFGISYGTQLAADYAQLFPRHTRALVLDAPLDHSQAEGAQVTDELMAAEDSFNRFARWCDTAPACELRGQDVAAVFDRLVASADTHPIPVAGALRPVTGEDIRMGTKGLLRFKESSIYGPDLSWAGLSRALAATLAGDAAAFAPVPAGVPQESMFALLGVACTDYVPQIDSYAEMQQRMQLARQLAPHLQGASETWAANFCIDWPVAATNPPHALDVRGVPALLVHAVHDPSDAYRWALQLGQQIRGSDLLTRTGDGHTSYHTSPCARSAIDAYLIHPEAPADRVCDE